MDLIRADYPHFPATQPLAETLDLTQAAHLQLKEPVLLSGPPHADLWITRSAAAPIERALEEAMRADELEAHVTREQVLFVHWMPSDSGPWRPYVVCRRIGHDVEVVCSSSRKILDARQDYRWEDAFSWDDKVVVPTASGISIFHFAESEPESHFQFSSSPNAATPPQALLDTRGLLAWTPWDARCAGSGHAARYVQDKWVDLSSLGGWPDRIVHLVPLLDGSVLQMIGTDGGAVQLAINTLDQPRIDQDRIADLVDALNDADEEKRLDAYRQLTRYGPGIWPILKKLQPDQPPPAQARINQLLRATIQPTLGGMTLVGRQSMQIAQRLADGGIVFYVPDGVSIPSLDGPPAVQTSAWLSIRPGRSVELLPPALTSDLKLGEARLWALGDDWIVRTDGSGPRRFIGNGFTPLLRKGEEAFDEVVGIDHRGRWLLRKSHPSRSEDQISLLIDPTLPDPTPRLPAWEIDTAQSVGWDKDDWPVVQRGAAYALTATDWRLLDAGQKVFTELPTSPAVASAASARTETPLLIDPDGNRYFDGVSTLKRIDRAGRTVVWALPPIATGNGDAHLLRTSEGLLFLFNQPGRILRIRPAPQPRPEASGEGARDRPERLGAAPAAQPFTIEATFTRSVPNVDHPTRIWLDPAGRIAIAWQNRLTLFFPNGYIPGAIAEKMQKRAGEEQ